MSPGEFAGGDGLVDIHCHALPGVDDGAASVAMGLDMLRRAADEGVDDVVLTPHYRPEDGPERAQPLQDYFEGFAVAVAEIDAAFVGAVGTSNLSNLNSRTRDCS